MKAMAIDRAGGPDVMQYRELPDPEPKPGEVVVDIHAASVNAADTKVRADAARMAYFPYVLGRDFSGTVAALGQGVTDFQLGEGVFGILAAGREGTYAEKVAEKAAILAKKPPELSHVELAALAMPGLTALSAIEGTLKLKRGETILIQGGAGGVGGFAVQLAKHLGAHVITTARKDNHDYVRSLGADEAIDYQAQDFTKSVADVDAVFDTVGGDVAIRSFAVLKPGGRAAFVASGPNAPTPTRGDVVALRPPVPRGRAPLERIVALVREGGVRPPQIKTYPLQDAAQAHRLSDSRHFRGKLVLQVR